MKVWPQIGKMTFLDAGWPWYSLDSGANWLKWNCFFPLKLQNQCFLHIQLKTASLLKSLPRKKLPVNFAWAFQMVLVVDKLSATAGNALSPCSIPGSGRSPGGGHCGPLQYSCLENPMDRRAWWAAFHKVAQTWRWLKWLSTASNLCHVLEMHSPICLSSALSKLEFQATGEKKRERHFKSQAENYEISVWIYVLCLSVHLCFGVTLLKLVCKWALIQLT